MITLLVIILALLVLGTAFGGPYAGWFSATGAVALLLYLLGILLVIYLVFSVIGAGLGIR